MAKDFKIIPTVERSKTATVLYVTPDTVAAKLMGVLGSLEYIKGEAKRTLDELSLDVSHIELATIGLLQMKVIRSCEWLMDIIRGVDFPADLIAEAEVLEHDTGEIMLRLQIRAITNDGEFIIVMALVVSIYKTKSDKSSYNPEDVMNVLRNPPARFVDMDTTLFQAPNWRTIKVLLDNMYERLTQNGTFRNGHLDDLGKDYYVTYGNTIYSSGEDLFLGLHLNPNVYTVKTHIAAPSTY